MFDFLGPFGSCRPCSYIHPGQNYNDKKTFPPIWVLSLLFIFVCKLHILTFPSVLNAKLVLNPHPPVFTIARLPPHPMQGESQRITQKLGLGEGKSDDYIKKTRHCPFFFSLDSLRFPHMQGAKV